MGEIITRRNLPHWYVPGAMHFVTYRLASTLPRHVIDSFQRHKERWLREKRPAGMSLARYRERIHKRLFALYDQYLDQHFGDIHWLDDPRVATQVCKSLYHFDGERYHLLAYCVMPNHVHVVFLPLDLPAKTDKDWEVRELGETEDKKSPLSRIMHSLKSYTAHEANRILGREGQFWQHESYDHWVRDEAELERIVDYINANPVSAGLAARPHEYFWCSAHDRFLKDGDTSGWLGT